MVNKFNKNKIVLAKILNMFFSMFFYTKKETESIDLLGVKNILIIDPAMIGDMVMLEPFFRILKKNAPQAKITLVSTKVAEPILKDTCLIDDYICVEKNIFEYPACNRKYRNAYHDAIKLINKKKYDVAIEPRGDIRYLHFMHYCNAQRKVSYNYMGGECFLTDVIRPSVETEHIIEEEMYLLRAIGCEFDLNDMFPGLTLTEEQETCNEIFFQENELKNKYVLGIHPGSSLYIKQWKGYPALVHKLGAEFNDFAIVLFEGPNEKNAADAVERAAVDCGVKCIRSKTDILTYMRLLAACDLVICNDSGAGHIAAAYGVKVISIFGPVLPSLARPYGRNRCVCISNDDIECKPCLSSECKKSCECINAITVEEVFDALKNI